MIVGTLTSRRGAWTLESLTMMCDDHVRDVPRTLRLPVEQRVYAFLLQLRELSAGAELFEHDAPVLHVNLLCDDLLCQTYTMSQASIP